MLLSQHSSRLRWKAEGCQKQVEALESWRQTSPETKPPSADSTNPGNLALRFDLLSGEFGLNLAHLCRQLLWSARFKAEERSRSPVLESTLVGRLSRCENTSLVIRRIRPITQVVDQSDTEVNA